MDIQILEAQITGITARLKELRDHETLFNRAGGFDEAIERSLADRVTAERDIATVKKDLADLQAKKSEALKATTEALSGKMSQVLPEGKAVFEIGEDGLNIGWMKGAPHHPELYFHPWAGLSGSERNCFDQALSFALLGDGEKIILMELAESDTEHLGALLDHLAKNTHQDTQIIACTWMRPRQVEGWAVVEVGNG
jgi:hypothetical protein